MSDDSNTALGLERIACAIEALTLTWAKAHPGVKPFRVRQITQPARHGYGGTDIVGYKIVDSKGKDVLKQSNDCFHKEDEDDDNEKDDD